MIDSIINSNDIENADIGILGVPYDASASFGKGAFRGPSSVKECLDIQIELFDRFTKNEPCYERNIAYEQFPDSINQEKPEDMVQKVFERHKDIQGFPIVLGGNHNVAIGAFQSFAEKENVKDITILHVDAHLDMHDDDSEYNEVNPSKYAHSCIMRRCIDLGFPSVSVGVRTYSKDEYEFISRKDLKVFEWNTLDGKTPSIEEIIEAIQTEKVYITFDLDGLDPAHAPGTGTPVPGGLSWNYATRLIIELFQKKQVVGMDIVEIAPQEGDLLTPCSAAQLCYTSIAQYIQKYEK